MPYHIHEVDRLALTQDDGAGNLVLGIQNTVHAHFSDEVTLDGQLVVNGAYHEQYADELSDLFRMVMDDTYHLHDADLSDVQPTYPPHESYHKHVISQSVGTVSEVTLIVTGSNPVGVGACSLPSMESVAYGFYQADIELPSLTSTATGTVGIAANGSVFIPSLTASAYSGAVGSVTLEGLTGDASGLTGVIASGSIVLPLLQSTVTAHQDISGSGSITLSLSMLSGTSGIAGIASATGEASLSMSLPKLVCAGTGILGASGTASLTLKALTMEATGYFDITANSNSVSLPLLVIHNNNYNDAVGDNGTDHRVDSTLTYSRW